MSKGQQFNLDGFIQNSDGTYSKAKTASQPREKKFINNSREIGNYGMPEITSSGQSQIHTQEEGWVDATKLGHKPNLRYLKLTLFGIPMPKQSVRASNGHFWQPQITVDRKNDYIRQIKEQLPKDFTPFQTEAHLIKFHCIFPPLKAFHKIKGRMDAIRNGEIFYKNTKPDLIDNLKKLVFDSMTGLVNKDDSIIVTENDTAKYYGVGGCIIIEIKGY